MFPHARIQKILLVTLATAICTLAAEVTPERLENAEKEPHNWLTYGGTYKAWRYSPLDQINRGNVRKLAPVWALQVGELTGGIQSTPLVADGVMYLIGPWNRIFALDAATGEEIWHYYYPKPKNVTFYGTWNRGLAIGHGLVFIGTMDNHLLALDAKRGREVWKVEIEDADQCGCNITGAPLVVKDKVITGVSGGDSAHRGYLDAYDVKTGRRAWRFWTIPGPGEPGHETWEGDSWRYGGAGTWLTGSYDPELDLLYWTVGNPTPDMYGDDREGDNLYTNSVIALDPDSGKLRWYYQEIPHEVWDFDSAYESILVDLDYKGRMRKLLVNPSKSGFTWVLDRTNGEFLNAWSLVENYNWIERIDEKGNLIGRLEPEVGVGKFICPSMAGGRGWNHGAYSPKTGWFYSTGNEWCNILRARPEEPRPGKVFMGGEAEMRPPPGGKPSAHLGAYDPITGQRQWTYRPKYPLADSQLVTGSNLLFTGDYEGRFNAFDATTGKKLWSFRTGAAHRAGPITYAVDGRQYVAAPSGSSAAGLASLWPELKDSPAGSTLFVFALPESK